MGCRVVWYIFTDILSNVLAQTTSLNMFMLSKRYIQNDILEIFLVIKMPLRILPSSGLLGGVRWFKTDVLGLHIGAIFKGYDV
jgi:hypothetical protein